MLFQRFLVRKDIGLVWYLTLVTIRRKRNVEMLVGFWAEIQVEGGLRGGYLLEERSRILWIIVSEFWLWGITIRAFQSTVYVISCRNSCFCWTKFWYFEAKYLMLCLNTNLQNLCSKPLLHSFLGHLWICVHPIQLLFHSIPESVSCSLFFFVSCP